ncbi:MAG: nitroreductase family protein [Candidatus Aminicenantes bacterium]|nr:MAG: nitroreductase family protein [Candidatus Aminicenantes bacterium]
MYLKELLKIIKERRSIREFTKAKINDEEITILIDAARYAPSNSNRQAWKFIILKSDRIKSEIAEAVKEKTVKIKQGIEDKEFLDMFGDYTKYFLVFSRAPIVIIVLYKTGLSIVDHVLPGVDAGAGIRKVESELISVSMAMQNLLLAAHAMGLGACCMTSPLVAYAEIKRILDIRPPFEIAALIPIGKYEKQPEPVSRKRVDRIIEIVE